MLDPIYDEFMDEVKQIKLKAPKIPYTSNLTGNWITEKEATNPVYWARHANNTARFSDALEKAWQVNNCILLEVGPGNTLSVLAMQQPESRKVDNPTTVSSLRPEYDNQSDLNYFLTSVGKLWLSGIEIDWEKLYENKKPSRIPLPTYSFQKENYWIEEEPAEVEKISQNSINKVKRNEFKDWFYIPGWKRIGFIYQNEPSSVFTEGTLWLIFLDSKNFGHPISNFLQERGQTVVTVIFGKSFSKENGNNFTIDPRDNGHYTDLFRELKSLNSKSVNIIHLGCFSREDDSCFEYQNDNIQYLGFYSLLFITQSISKLNISLPINIEIITSQVHQVTGDEILCPKKALLLGPCGVIPKEFSNINCFNVDLPIDDVASKLPKELIQKLIGEFDNTNIEHLVAYRGKFRWVKRFDQVELETNGEENLSSQLTKKGRIRQRGVYLITGGTGGIGLTIARYLAESFQARLVLTQKSELPEKSKWKEYLNKSHEDNILNQKLKRLIELEELGAEVLVFGAEVSDEEKMREVIVKTGNVFGEINGVIHSAGIVKAGIIPAKERDSIESVFAPKVNGTLILYDLVKEMKLDFFALCSSITSVITPYAEIDYSAANAFLDSFSQYSNSLDKFYTISINWPGWTEIGQLVNLKVLKGTEKWKEAALKKAISPKDGLEAFKLAINSNFSQIVVSPEPLDNSDLEIYPSQLIDAAVKNFEQSSEEINKSSKNFKDNLDNDISSIEEKLSLIWQDILGVKKINENDNFFDLGGHSLLAIQLISSIRKSFKVDIDLGVLFDVSSLKEMANKILDKVSDF
jgi:NAD(P)-dependent dehydrogenase (short-subunit alcohol dehydrogenase family)/acyl carrier protein